MLRLLSSPKSRRHVTSGEPPLDTEEDHTKLESPAPTRTSGSISPATDSTHVSAPTDVVAWDAPAKPKSSASSASARTSPSPSRSPPSSPLRRGLSSSPAAVRPASPNEIELALALTVTPASPQEASTSPSSRRSTGGLSTRIKHLVSKEKRRFSADGFDLDLTYVTRRLVALGYPAEKLEGFYRNHYRDVFRFFEQRHGGHYRVYNLCVERRYAAESRFHGRVAEFGFEDHSPPPLAMLLPFCRDVHAWLQAHPKNVAAVHCKAGKGRTGVMLCVYLLYARRWRSAHGALELFAAARSLKRQGVTIPSQRRFVEYFAELCRRAEDEMERQDSATAALREQSMTLGDYHAHWEAESRESLTDVVVAPHAQPEMPERVHLVLVAVVLRGVGKKAEAAADWRVRIECGAVAPRAAVYDLSGGFQQQHKQQRSGGDQGQAELEELTLDGERVVVWDEVKVQLRRRAGTALGHFWFHTAFVDDARLELELAKSEIDKVVKDIKNGHKKFAPDFSVRLRFERATPQEIADPAGDHRRRRLAAPVTPRHRQSKSSYIDFSARA